MKRNFSLKKAYTGSTQTVSANNWARGFVRFFKRKILLRGALLVSTYILYKFYINNIILNSVWLFVM